MGSSLLFLISITVAPLITSILKTDTALAAGAYAASDVLGQLDQNGNPSYTQGLINAVGLNAPYNTLLDPVHHHLFVADTSNGRILIYSLDNSNNLISRNAAYVLGEPDFLVQNYNTTQNGMTYPEGLAFNSSAQQLFVSDYYNNRVLVYDLASGITNGMNASYVLGQPDFTSQANVTTQSGMGAPGALSFDAATTQLYVADNNNSRVLIYDLSGGITNGMNASYVLGQPDFTSNNSVTTQDGMSFPSGVAVDPSSRRIFVADTSNNRTLVYDLSAGITNGMNAAYVLGQPDFTSSNAATTQSGISRPQDVTFSSATNQLFVGDAGNNRIVIYDLSSGITNGMNASNLLGQISSSGQPAYDTHYNQNQQNSDFGGYPTGTYVDTVRHRLFVAACGSWITVYNLDTNNNLINHHPAYILGSRTDTSVSQSTMQCPAGLAYDPAQSLLFTADSDSNRIVVYDLSAGITNGMNAAYVLGQPDFTSTNCSTDQASLCQPYGGMVFDPATNYFYVSDSSNARVLIYDLSNGITNGMNAAYVLGQPGFTSSTPNLTQDGLNTPYGLALDSARHQLFVADDDYQQNARVLIYDISNLASGMNASYVLGPSDFTSTASTDPNSPTATSMDPEMLAYDSAHQTLFVGDDAESRILVFNLSSGITNGMNPSGVLGVPDFTTNSYRSPGRCAEPSQTSLCDTEGLDDYYDTANNRFYVSDSANNRVIIYDFAKLASITVNPVVATPYSVNVGAHTQGTTSYSITSGALPAGLQLNTSSGVLSGVPTTTGSYTFTVAVSDDNGNAGTYTDIKSYTLIVAAASSNPNNTNNTDTGTTPPTNTAQNSSSSSGSSSGSAVSSRPAASSSSNTNPETIDPNNSSDNPVTTATQPAENQASQTQADVQPAHRHMWWYLSGVPVLALAFLLFKSLAKRL